MHLTNHQNYPDALLLAVERGLHQPEPGIYGVTSLVDAPLIRHLRLTRWEDLVTDVDDYLHALFGQAWHAFLEKHTNDRGEIGWTYETRGVMVRGVSDLYKEGGIIEDYKAVSAWSFVFGTKEWERQLNLYALLARKNGYPVNELYIDAFIKDWSEWEAKKSHGDGYPDKRFYRVAMPLWDQAKQEQYLNERLDAHLAEPTECTPDQKWASTDTYAVMKDGQKSARRVLTSLAAAQQWVEEQKDQRHLSIVKRPGACKRCERFCSVRSVCPYVRQ